MGAYIILNISLIIVYEQRPFGRGVQLLRLPGRGFQLLGLLVPLCSIDLYTLEFIPALQSIQLFCIITVILKAQLVLY